MCCSEKMIEKSLCGKTFENRYRNRISRYLLRKLSFLETGKAAVCRDVLKNPVKHLCWSPRLPAVFAPFLWKVSSLITCEKNHLRRSSFFKKTF